MSQTATTDLPFIGHPEFNILLREDQAWLAERGELDNQQVYALGPAHRCVRDFDCWHEEKLDGPFLCAISTDGIGRGRGADPLALLDELESLQTTGVENPARRFIELAIQQRPKDFDDNLTLAIIRAE